MAGKLPFLARWALKKAAARSSVPILSPARDSQSCSAPLAAGHDSTATRLDLPDIDSITAATDFTVFMAQGVPDSLRQQAMRTLWRADPIFAVHDGLTDYADDFRGDPDGIVTTAYRVGKGYLEGADQAEGGAGDPPSEQPVGERVEEGNPGDRPTGDA